MVADLGIGGLAQMLAAVVAQDCQVLVVMVELQQLGLLVRTMVPMAPQAAHLFKVVVREVLLALRMLLPLRLVPHLLEQRAGAQEAEEMELDLSIMTVLLAAHPVT